MTSARERAVEAGVKQFHHEVMGDQDLPWEAIETEIQVSVTACICRVLRAAFPILAEELDLDLALAEQFARVGDVARLTSALGDARAHIQQMAEAL